jgi:cytochrome c oxidase cbb3-type subunit 3
MRIICLGLIAGSLLAADNPFARNPVAVAAGRATFLERCAVCHGQDAAGGQAANLLRARAVIQGTDEALFELIRTGLPGTAMPPQTDLTEDGVWQLVSYLHSAARPGEQPPVEGDAEAGARLFTEKGCINCHIVDGKGGFWGPGLDTIASRKKTADIRVDILEPNAEVDEGFRRVSIQTKAGRTVEGLLKNEDTASLQVLRKDGSFALLNRTDVSSMDKLEGSPMPAAKNLTEAEMMNLLAFLDRQRDPFLPFERGFGNY